MHFNDFLNNKHNDTKSYLQSNCLKYADIITYNSNPNQCIQCTLYDRHTT